MASKSEEFAVEQSGDGASEERGSAPLAHRNAETIRAALKDAVKMCPCSLRERESGHRIDCYAPGAKDALAAMEEIERETLRLDWLEGEMEREREAWAVFERANPRGALPPVALFRKNQPITRAAIDAAMQPTAKPIIIADLTLDEDQGK